MDYQLFLNPMVVFAALFFGLLFGFLLQKGGVAQFDVIVGQLLLKDFTVMKIIFTAVVSGSIGIYTMAAFGMIPAFHLSKIPLLFTLMGGMVFGVGMSLTGYCPGTAIAALASGAKDMLFGISGMICGAVLFNELSFLIIPYLEKKDFACQQTIASLFSLPVSTVIIALGLIWLVFAATLWKIESKKRRFHSCS